MLVTFGLAYFWIIWVSHCVCIRLCQLQLRDTVTELLLVDVDHQDSLIVHLVLLCPY